jgi:phosphoribosylamine--glycine ligase
LKILIIGSGAREHALAWKISQSPKLSQLYIAPGNGGTAGLGKNLNIKADDIQSLCATAKDLDIDLAVVGPEIPLDKGIVDTFADSHIDIFGPSKKAARIESSKAFAKGLMLKYGIPCAQSKSFSDYTDAKKYLQDQYFPMVIKADGLAAGKGVIIAKTKSEALHALEDIMLAKTFGEAGNQVVIEEFLRGKEVSLLSFTDGKTTVPMVPACDYKRVGDQDTGLNTGGMGSYSPPGFFSKTMLWDVTENIIKPTINALAEENSPYKGVLYTGLIITEDGPRVLEYNARFGDPETQVILPRLKTDLVEIMLTVIQGSLESINIQWEDNACVGVVLASVGYPEKYQTGYAIKGLDEIDQGIYIFHAGTRLDETNHAVVTDGGRVLTMAASGVNMAQAREKVYRNISKIDFTGCHYRKDIAAREV